MLRRLILFQGVVVAMVVSGAWHLAEAGIGSMPASAFVEVARKADLVVVGLLEQQVNLGANYVQTAPGSDAVLRLRIDRTLKGDTAGASLECVWRSGSRAPQSLVGAYGLWFLAAEPGGPRLLPVSASALSPWEVGLPLPSEPLPETDGYAAGAALVDKLVVELRIAARSGDAGTASLAYLALSELLYRGSRLASDHLRMRRAEEADCPTAGLVAEFDGMVVAHLDRLLAAGAGTSIPQGLVSALCAVSDPATVPGLSRLLKEPLSKRCAAEALRNIHSSEALPSLAALLDDRDPEMQYLALGGLAAYASEHAPEDNASTLPGRGPLATDETRRHSPSHSLFLSDPARYLSFWKSWWRSRAVAAH